MRALGLVAALGLAALVGACTAIDNFNHFSFVYDAGAEDMLPEPNFGQACSDTCAQPVPSRPLMCLHMIGSRTAQGGICTRTCTASAGAAACSDFADAVCVTVEGMDLCLPHCDPSVGRNCRTGYACCDNHNVITTAGACAPPTTDLCH
jgi:hypothetical protein